MSYPFLCRFVGGVAAIAFFGSIHAGALYAGTASPRGGAPAAMIDIDPPGNTINGSTYGTSSFRITNQSAGGQRIARVRLDFRTAVFRDLVFDPNGQAGDLTAKAFRADTGASETGPVTHTLSSPHDDGFDVIEITFGGFDPGETFTFSIDVDPTSIRGANAPGPQESGSISGLELVGSHVTVVFNDQTTLAGNSFRTPNALDASRCSLRPAAPPAPTLSVVGVAAPPAVVTSTNRTARIVAPPGARIRLLIVEGGLFTQGLPGGGFDLDPFEANSAAAVREYSADVPAAGVVEIPVVLTQSNAAAGINHLIAAIETATGETGPTSQTIVLQLGSDAIVPGDANTDGIVNGRDVTAFIDILRMGGAPGEGEADMNEDGVVNVLDVPQFVSELTRRR